jgi:hypothetical protein
MLYTKLQITITYYKHCIPNYHNYACRHLGTCKMILVVYVVPFNPLFHHLVHKHQYIECLLHIVILHYLTFYIIIVKNLY